VFINPVSLSFDVSSDIVILCPHGNYVKFIRFKEFLRLNKIAKQELVFALNVPHVFTATRVIIAIIIAILLFSRGDTAIFAAGILIIVAAITDFFDGFLARKLKQASLVGSLFDIIADQLLFMPSLILSIRAGLFERTHGLMPFTPYPYAVPALAGGITVLVGVGIFLWKRRRHAMVFPTPMVAKTNFWFWLAPLVLAILKLGPDLLLAILMYLAIISTILTFYSYLKKGSYVFTD
jgi:phosphatidylglycerophosphate synthase